ncbi:MAG: hypothetical protein LKE46_06045 [Clostridium sp.]|jgi:hypothetical protein|uniref:hypothetical protein n=2 Tax=Clostridium sp. TaxID=1506 RepID=UPI0025B92A70|nr:hypothetical protein [Clostridium sp.]MCH3963817.1 hypothetical protein [Clostridium sp.]MCI1716936.1 hypothetical protein [Clostridium sp.]MCI1801345.1 hypothetical protein [Clostridium sp.]MCI1815191.1 hypothetical protein [Clostridium sp.]MCI1872025.1 hypothetical protein [Clostridium sp.]
MRVEIYYNGIKNARDAAEKFRNEGFSNSAVDLNDSYIDFDNHEYNFSDAIINSGVFSDNRSSKLGSGMGSFHDVLNSNYKVVVNIDSSNSYDELDKLKKVIEETGGNLRITI